MLGETQVQLDSMHGKEEGATASFKSQILIAFFITRIENTYAKAGIHAAMKSGMPATGVCGTGRSASAVNRKASTTYRARILPKERAATTSALEEEFMATSSRHQANQPCPVRSDPNSAKS